MNRYRLVASFVGVGLAVAAIAFDDKRIAWLAMLVLALALGIRMASRRAANRHPPDGE